MDGLIVRYLLIVLIRIFDRAVFHTGSTTRAFIFFDIPGFPVQCYLKVTCFTFYLVNFSIGEDFYVWMPADLDQFRCEYSHTAVIGRKGLVELGHVAAYARRLLDQVHLKTGSSKIEGGLDTADPSTNNHDVSKITLSETFAELLHIFFER